MQMRTLSLSLLLLFACGYLSAQEPVENLDILTNWWPSANQCTDANTTTVPLAQILSNPESYYGECVLTEGYYKARALFLSKRDMSRKHPTSNERSSDRRLGVYGNDTQLNILNHKDGEVTQVSGMMSSCDALYDEGTIMVLGYCHYTGGPIIGLVPE